MHNLQDYLLGILNRGIAKGGLCGGGA